MGLITFENIGIHAMSGTIPKKVVKTRSLVDYFDTKEIEKFIEITGVEERRFVEEGVCSSDLCCNAAENLFDNCEDISRNDIDVLIFVSQTADYRIPATSTNLQDRLKLSKNTIVYDLNMSCSGFIHGLLLSYTFLSLPSINNVLLLVGETLSKAISLKDKSTGLLMGDGGAAVLINKNDKYGKSYFSVNTDGANLDSVLIPGGGFRNVSSKETLEMREYEDGSIRSMEQVAMNGMDVFSFAISELPKDIKKLLEYAGISIDDVDKYAFHQANTFMTEFIVKKAKADKSKLLRSIEKFGNTGGASIPLTMVENRDEIKSNSSILMNSIGAGFAYGTVLLNIAECNILEMNEI